MSAPSERWRCERATSAHADGLLALFESAGSGCFCNYWYFEGDKNAWLERCYVKPEENRAALVRRLASDELCGVVAFSAEDASAPCGWLNVSRAGAVPRLYDQRVYRKLPCFQAEPGGRENVYAVACFYVAEAARGRGVARALLGTAVRLVEAAGGSALEAFPRAGPGTEGESERLRADQVWLGPVALFQDAGFSPVSDFRPYPVLRLQLR